MSEQFPPPCCAKCLKAQQYSANRIAELEAENRRLREQLDEQNEVIKDLDNALTMLETDDD